MKLEIPGPLINPLAYIYIYMRCRVIIWAKFGHLKGYYLGQVCFLKTLFAEKHYKNRGFNIFWKKYAQKIEGLISGPSWPFLCCNKHGLDNNPYLAQKITLQNGHFSFFCFWKCAEIPIFIVFFEHHPKFGQKRGKQKDNFSHFAKHRLLKNHFVATPLLTKIGVFQLVFLKPKTLMLNKNITEYQEKQR